MQERIYRAGAVGIDGMLVLSQSFRFVDSDVFRGLWVGTGIGGGDCKMVGVGVDVVNEVWATGNVNIAIRSQLVQ